MTKTIAEIKELAAQKNVHLDASLSVLFSGASSLMQLTEKQQKVLINIENKTTINTSQFQWRASIQWNNRSFGI